MFSHVYDGKWDRSALDYLALVDSWHVVTRSDSVPEGKPVAARLLGERIVLWRANGQIHAWKDYCAHRGAPLSLGSVKGCELVCPYHGWRFNEEGKCTLVPAHPDHAPPARSVIQRYKAVEQYGFVWVSLGTPEADVPRLPQWGNPEYRQAYAGPYPYQANALRCMDNFMDASHFPHVHSGMNGRGDMPDTTIDYQVIVQERELQTTEFCVVQPYADHRGLPLTVWYRYYCLGPTVAYSDKVTGEGQHWFTWCAITPVDEAEAIFWLVMSFNYGKEVSDEKIRERQQIVFGTQDKWIVEAQRPHRMPLDVSEEMHVKSDRLGVAYRRWLKSLGEKKQRQLSGADAGLIAS